MPSSNSKQQKEEQLIKATNWVYPEQHQEILPGRPQDFLGGGHDPRDDAVREHYVKDRKPPIKLNNASCGHVKDSPFFHPTNTEPIYSHVHQPPAVHHFKLPKEPKEEEEEQVKASVDHDGEQEERNIAKRLQQELKAFDNKLDYIEKQMKDLEIRRQFALNEREAVEKSLKQLQE